MIMAQPPFLSAQGLLRACTRQSALGRIWPANSCLPKAIAWPHDSYVPWVEMTLGKIFLKSLKNEKVGHCGPCRPASVELHHQSSATIATAPRPPDLQHAKTTRRPHAFTRTPPPPPDPRRRLCEEKGTRVIREHWSSGQDVLEFQNH
jgi:hypothetical protein